MKCTAFAVLTLVTLASASDFNLRAAANRLLGNKSSDPAEARVMVHGLLQETSAEDLSIISKSVVAAYNSAYSATGYSFTALETKASVSGPDNVGWWWGRNFWPGCRWCPDDDALADSNTDAQAQAQLIFVEAMPVGPTGNNAAIQSVAMQDMHLGDIHKKFEENFCGLLRTSGSKNLASASQCSLSFLETPGHTASSVPVESAYSTNNGEAEQAQVVMHGTLHDLSEKDYAVIDTTILAAYNEAFAKTGYAASSFKAVADIKMPNNDDNALMVNAATMVSAQWWWGRNFWPGCRWCPDDDATALSDYPILEESDMAFMHEAFEKTFCSKLQNSGLANFANVNNCSFRFVNTPTDVALKAAQE
jgi:hypothetical protein